MVLTACIVALEKERVIVDAIILCGGRGTRLSGTVPGLPKVLAPVAGKPFIDYVLFLLIRSGLVGRIVLATGYMAEQVESKYKGHIGGVQLVHSREHEPLGTAGAVVNAIDKYNISEKFLLVNGDSIIDYDLGGLLELKAESACSVCMGLFKSEDSSRYGAVALDGESKIIKFKEKGGVPMPGLINAGIYLCSRNVFEPLDAGRMISLENEVLPELVAEGRVFGKVIGDSFIDIGLPETYYQAASFIRDLPIFSSE